MAEASEQGHKQHRTSKAGATVKKKQKSEKKKQRRAGEEKQKNPKVPFFSFLSSHFSSARKEALIVFKQLGLQEARLIYTNGFSLSRRHLHFNHR